MERKGYIKLVNVNCINKRGQISFLTIRSVWDSSSLANETTSTTVTPLLTLREKKKGMQCISCLIKEVGGRTEVQ